MKKLLFTIFALGILPINTAHAMVVVCPTCSSLVTQIVEKATSLQNYAETIKHTINQAAQIQNQIAAYENMLKNTEGLSMESISNIKGLLNDLNHVGSELDIVKANVNALQQIYEEQFPDFSNMTNWDDGVKETLSNMSQEVRSATQATFQATGAQLDELLGNEDEFDEHVDELLATPEGQMQALSSANQLASLQVQESRLLRETVLIQAQAEATIQAREESEKQLSKSITREFLEVPADRDYTPTGIEL